MGVRGKRVKVKFSKSIIISSAIGCFLYSLLTAFFCQWPKLPISLTFFMKRMFKWKFKEKAFRVSLAFAVFYPFTYGDILVKA